MSSHKQQDPEIDIKISSSKTPNLSFSFFTKIKDFIHSHIEPSQPPIPDGKFFDKEFYPSDKTFFGAHTPKYGVKWVRAEQLCSNPTQIYNEFSPTDIKQGGIGNCWLVAALMCLAENPSILSKTFSTNRANQDGKYTLTLYRKNLPYSVTVDSFVPVHSCTDTPLGITSHSKQLWPLLIEKAYAKLNGSYASLISGECHEAFMDMTGLPSGLLQDKSKVEMWGILSTRMNSGNYLLTCAINSEESGHGKAHMKHMGLLTDHAYSVLGVKEHMAATPNGRPLRLIQIRNPWSRFEWKGDYSDHSKKWTSELSKYYHLCVDDKDGVFWMNFNKFYELFDTFSFCDVGEFEFNISRIPFKINFNSSNGVNNSININPKNGESDGINFNSYHPKNGVDPTLPSFQVSVPKNCVLNYIILHQLDQRKSHHLKKYIDLSAFIMDEQTGKCIALLKNTLDRFTWKKIFLSHGTYRIVPYSSGIHSSSSTEITLSLYASPHENNNDKNNKEIEIKVTKKDFDWDILNAAKGSAIDLLGKYVKQRAKPYGVKIVNNSGLVFAGLKTDFNLRKSVVYTVDSVRCRNMSPAFDSWQGMEEKSFLMPKSDGRDIACFGSFIRSDNEECQFKMDVQYKIL